MRDVLKNKIAIATNNRNKAREIISILEILTSPKVKFTIPIDLDISDSPDENGFDYKSNAIIKARFYGERTDIITIADDSGLEVFSLEGFPGLKSARMQSPGNTDRSRCDALLYKMRFVPTSERGARFVCEAVAYVPESDLIFSARGEWDGVIAESPCGDGGFGYDPIFYIPELGKTAAQLKPEEKNVISHRGKAFRLLWNEIKDYFQEDV